MTDHFTAKQIYCRACQEQITFPGQYVIVNGKTYHVGCETIPVFAQVVRIEDDSEGASAGE